MATLKKTIPLNRVEGDLELHLELDGDTVSEVRSVGTMYRGIENLMKGRGPMDSLVITPRICGVCSTAHHLASVRALEDDAQNMRRQVAELDPTCTVTVDEIDVPADDGPKADGAQRLQGCGCCLCTFHCVLLLFSSFVGSCPSWVCIPQNGQNIRFLGPV